MHNMCSLSDDTIAQLTPPKLKKSIQKNLQFLRLQFCVKILNMQTWDFSQLILERRGIFIYDAKLNIKAFIILATIKKVLISSMIISLFALQ